jgi:hypothetical protein
MVEVSVTYKEPVVRPIESLTLTLNEQEAKTLVAILSRIGGCPDNSPRKHAANILEAIMRETRGAGGLDCGAESACVNNNDHSGSIYFGNY